MEQPDTKEIVAFDFSPTIFDPNKEQLEAIKAEVANITADPTKITKEELAVVNETKNKLVKARTTIEKVGKAAREKAVKFQKDVIAYEKELIGIIEPEEKRLKEIESDAKEHAMKEERLKTLPEYKAKLASIGDAVDITDEELLALDPNERDAYYNQRLGAHLEAQKAAAAEKEAAEAAAKAEEQKKIDEAKAEIEREKEKIQTEKVNARIQRLLSAGFRDEGTAYRYDEKLSIEKFAVSNFESTTDEFFNDYMNRAIAYIEADKKVKEEKAEEEKKAEIKAAEEAATAKAQEEAKQQKAAEEAKRQANEAAEKKAAEEAAAKEAAEKAERESQEEFQQWLNEHSYDEKIHKIEEKDGTYTLYQWIASYTPDK